VFDGLYLLLYNFFCSLKWKPPTEEEDFRMWRTFKKTVTDKLSAVSLGAFSDPFVYLLEKCE